ncbi:hypothetical protein LWI28_020929 [Acer negundo]|uniref:Uncharacterized protein n=1 Tax=Acer negundo TaxID=4023 RepID=A0AAD5I7N5_ACENE|nr:hypothetical protein LWI28_020929 [Acer negundo]
MEITKVYPLDAVYDNPDNVPEDVKANRILKMDCTGTFPSERIIPGYGGGMSSAKAALESDTLVLAFEAGRKHRIRVNTISAGPLRILAAKAIGFIDMMIDYYLENAPLQKELTAEEVGNTAAFLASPLASAITSAVVYVDNGLNAMGVGVDSPIFENLDIPKEK